MHELPLYIKTAPLNIEVVTNLMSFDFCLSTDKSKLKSERASLEKRHVTEFDFISKFVEVMTNIVSKEEGKKKGLQMFEFSRLRDLLACLVKSLQLPLEHVKIMREVHVYYYLQCYHNNCFYFLHWCSYYFSIIRTCIFIIIIIIIITIAFMLASASSFKNPLCSCTNIFTIKAANFHQRMPIRPPVTT